MRYPLALLAALAALLLLSAPAAAATVHVDVQTDDNGATCTHPNCTLRGAITNSNVGDTIQVPPGDYHLNSTFGELTVSHTLSIVGAGATTTRIIGDGSHRVIHDNAGPVTYRNVTVSGGRDNGGGGELGGGGILDTSEQLLTLDHVRITNDEINQDDTGPLGIDAVGGGGVRASGPVLVNRSTIDGNFTTQQAEQNITGSGGAGLYVTGGELKVIDSEIDGNETSINGAEANPNANVATDGGGGVYVSGAGASLTLTRSTIAANTVGVEGANHINDNGGGGVYVNAAKITASNSTLSDNAAHIPALLIDNGGGGIFMTDSTGSLSSVTLAGNSATPAGTKTTMTDAGGAVYRDAGSLQARNTIIAGNSADMDANCFGTLTSAGHNIEDADTCGLSGPGDKKSTPIALGPLAAHGGPTRTRPISSNGPAFNAGAGCPGTDQRGVKRPAGLACDIGAFEIQVPDVTTGGATKVKASSARLHGRVVPNAHATTYHFRYGTTKAYGKTTKTTAAGSGPGPVPAIATLSKLKPATIYHYRLVATNSLGTTPGRDRKFTTHLKLPSHCVKGGRLTINLQHPAGTKITRVKTFVNGKGHDAFGGSNIKQITVESLPAKRFKLRVVAKLNHGGSVTGSHRYKPCS